MLKAGLSSRQRKGEVSSSNCCHSKHTHPCTLFPEREGGYS